MAHNCIDWTTTPPTRKIPLLVLTKGNDRVYTIVPKEFKTLEDIAKREFNLGDADVHISSSCVNLCDGLPARITENVWEHVSAYIGCATVEAAGGGLVEGRAPRGEEEPQGAENAADEHDGDAKGKQPMIVDEPDHPLGGRQSAPASEAAQDEEGPSEDRAEDHGCPTTPKSQHDEPADQDVSAALPRKPLGRRRRRLLSDDEGEGESWSELESRTQPRDPPSPPKPKTKRARGDDYRSEPDEQPSEEPDKPIKQEKREAGSSGSANPPQPQSQVATLAPAESGESHKVMIRVAHRPSKQESKFTTKSTTKVHKVLSGACKSFGLDANEASLYLIVSMEDEDGEVESLFPCDKNDSIARAGAERNVESRFLLKIAGEE